MDKPLQLHVEYQHKYGDTKTIEKTLTDIRALLETNERVTVVIQQVQKVGRTLYAHAFDGLFLPHKVIKALTALWGNHKEPLTKEIMVEYFTIEQMLSLPSMGRRSVFILCNELAKHKLYFKGTEELWKGPRHLCQRANFAMYGWLQVTPVKNRLRRYAT